MCDDSTIAEDLKGRIEGGTRRTVVLLDELTTHASTLHPFNGICYHRWPTPKNMFVEREKKCDSAQPLPIYFQSLSGHIADRK